MKKPTSPLLLFKDSRLKISGEWSVYFETTHGVPHELFELWVNKKLKGEKLC